MEDNTKIIIVVIVSIVISCIFSSIIGGGVTWFWNDVSSFLGLNKKKSGGVAPSGGGGVTPSGGGTIADFSSKWTCVREINVPLRLNSKGDVECASTNSKDCLWSSSCNVSSVPSNLNPLACGEQHKRLHGESGYSNVLHWCNKGFNALKSQQTPIPKDLAGCVQNWKYQQSTSSSNLSGPYSECTRENSDRDWCMLPAYVEGGQQNVAWKYTSNENDPDCLTNWNFYNSQGNIVKNGTNISRTITWDSGSDNVNRWCPLRVYVTGGPENKAWKYC